MPNLVSLSKPKPCPCNHCHKWTILVHVLAFWVSFLQLMQGKKGNCFDMQMAVGACAALARAQQTKNFLLWCLSPKSHINIQGVSRIKSSKIFYGVSLGSRTAVLELRYPVLHLGSELFPTFRLTITCSVLHILTSMQCVSPSSTFAAE